MSEVSVRLSELRHAAEQLKQSAFRLQIAVDSVVPIVNQSLLDALPLSENVAIYQAHKANIEALPSKIQAFSDNLSTAADDIANAVEAQNGVVHFYTPTRFDFAEYMRTRDLLQAQLAYNAPLTTQRQAVDEHTPANSFDARVPLSLITSIGYISGRNRPLYDTLVMTQNSLQDKADVLAQLTEQRARLGEDLDALKNRMLSYDPTTSVETQPRVVAMQGQLDALDGQIIGLETEISGLQFDVDTITQRLERVAPTMGADLSEIVALEGARNPAWMQESTFGCVNHIVDKMPLPNGVPRDALLWDDAALELPQYGISWGDTPLEGSVLQLDPSHPYADDRYGHVMYVERVEGDTVWVTDNLNPADPVRLQDLTSRLSGEDMRYLYFPWHTGA